MSDENTALLIIHPQMAFFQAPKPLYQADTMINNIKGLISKAHAANVPVIYLQENATGDLAWMNSTPLWHIHPDLTPTPADKVFQQWDSDVLGDPAVQRELENKHVGRLVVTGLQTEYCINTTCRNGSTLGYEMTLVSDGHSTFDSDTATAQQIIDQVTAGLHDLVTVKASQEISFEEQP